MAKESKKISLKGSKKISPAVMACINPHCSYRGKMNSKRGVGTILWTCPKCRAIISVEERRG